MTQVKNNFRLKATLRALKSPNFRLFFSGQSISLIGTWMQRIALSWLVYRLSNSSFLLGVVGFAGQFPSFLFAPFAGALADRFNRHRMVILTQVFSLLQASVLAYLVLSDTIEIWHIIALSVVLGIINAFDMPIRQSFLVEMVDNKSDLGNAIALNSTMVNSARLLGPSIAGGLIALTGEGVCFLINAVSYIPVIVSLLLMKIKPRVIKPKEIHVFQSIKLGFHYVADFVPIRAILLILALISFMGLPYVVLMPVFAKDILHGGPDALGFLMGASGIGALTGALYLASRESVLGLGRLIAYAAIILGGGLIFFSFSSSLYLSLLLMLFTGLGQMVLMASGNTLIQTLVDDEMRGRVMSFYVMAFMGAQPLGNLLAGSLASKIGASWTVCIGGIACAMGGLLFYRKLPALRKVVRPIYARKGIIPQIATGIQNASR